MRKWVISLPDKTWSPVYIVALFTFCCYKHQLLDLSFERWSVQPTRAVGQIPHNCPMFSLQYIGNRCTWRLARRLTSHFAWGERLKHRHVRLKRSRTPWWRHRNRLSLLHRSIELSDRLSDNSKLIFVPSHPPSSWCCAFDVTTTVCCTCKMMLVL